MKYCLFAFLMSFTIAGYSQVINVIAPTQQQAGSVDFFQHLLMRALEMSKDRFGEYQFAYHEFNLSQERSLRMLQRGEIDVLHTMTNREREKQYLAVKYPLVRGLMGHRQLVIDKSQLAEFDNITAAELSTKIACQGLHWPDSDVLEANNFSVARVLSFEAMYELIAKGRCDYFPRSILEVESELDEFKKRYPNLTTAPNIMLVYSTAVYFFVEKSNFALANRLNDGLARLELSGEMDKVFKSHPLTKGIFPLTKWENVRKVTLTNPYVQAPVVPLMAN